MDVDPATLHQSVPQDNAHHPPPPSPPVPPTPTAFEHMSFQVSSLMTMVQMLLANAAASVPSNAAPATTGRTSALPTGVKPPSPERFSANLHDRREVPLWLAATKSALSIAGHDLNSPKTIAFVSVFLDGRARNWWELTKATIFHTDPSIDPLLHEAAGFTSWDTFAAAFQKHLGEDRPTDRAMERLVKLQQTTSVLSYGEKFTQHIKMLPTLDSASTRFFYLQGLKTQIRQMMAGRFDDNTPWPELHDLAMQCDAVRSPINTSNYFQPTNPRHPVSSSATPMDIGNITTFNRSGSRSPSPHPRPHSSATRYTRPQTPASVRPRPKLTPEERAYLKANGGCFRCRQPGHFAHRCPENKNDKSTTGSPSSLATSRSVSPDSRPKN